MDELYSSAPLPSDFRSNYEDRLEKLRSSDDPDAFIGRMNPYTGEYISDAGDLDLYNQMRALSICYQDQLYDYRMRIHDMESELETSMKLVVDLAGFWRKLKAQRIVLVCACAILAILTFYFAFGSSADNQKRIDDLEHKYTSLLQESEQQMQDMEQNYLSQIETARNRGYHDGYAAGANAAFEYRK